MFSIVSMFSYICFALLAVSAVSARVVPRATPPAGWATDYLEPYDTYHCRYLALSCQYQHGTDFFDECCHPLLANESISSRPAQCQMPADVTCSDGTPVTSSASSPVPTGGSDDVDCSTEPSSTSPAAPTTTQPPVNVAQPPPTTTPPPAPQTTSTSSKAATSTSASPSGSSVDLSLNYGGFATFFYQNGVAGACGTVHSDNDYICAIDQARYGNSGNSSPLCGQQVQITNQNNGKTVTVTVADDCPTCTNSNSIDLSVAAFEALDDLSVGEVPIVWQFLN